MSRYPVLFDHAVFPTIAPFVPPKPRGQALKAFVAPELSGALRPTKITYARASTIWIRPKGKKFEHSESFDNGTQSSTDKMPDMNAHFHFLPGIDEVEIEWDVEYPKRVGKLELQLYSAHKSTPIFSKTWDGEAARTAAAKSDPSLPWSAITINDRDHPSNRPDAAHAPYQLRLLVTDADSGAVSTAWTYFDVMVHSIELHWGPAAWIPGGAITDTSPLFGPVSQAREPNVLSRLKKKLKPSDAEVTKIDGGDIFVDIPSACAGYRHWAEWQCFWKDLAFLRYRGLWGIGPRIPMIAKVYPMRADGSKLDPDASGGTHSWDDVGKVVGPAKILWDWHDRPKADRKVWEAKRWSTAGDFVMKALDYKPNVGDEPPDCLNCHVDRGGRRAGTDPIFPAAAANPLPSAVVAATARKWAAFSTVAVAGPFAGHAGVLFNPSRMAMDSYKVRALLATELTSDKAKPVLDVADKIDTLLSDNPGVPMGETGMMTVRRLIPARYVRKSNLYAAMDLKQIDDRFEMAGLKIEWTHEFWTEAEYKQHLNAALGGAIHQESDQEIRAHRHKDGSVKRRQNVAAMVAKGTLANFDHWFGWKAGKLKPGPSEVCLTQPSRPLVVNPFIVQGHKNWIAAKDTKSRTSDWQKYRTNKRPGGTEDDARVAHVLTKLSKKHRKEVLTEAERLYKAAGFTKFGELDEKEWACEHFSYNKGWIEVVMEHHQRKIMADAFEGVTFFHYINMWETIDNDGNEVARDYSLGGVAKVDTGVDLGLKSAFWVWDHPDDRRRGANGGPNTMNGNETAAHEFGHNLHLPHSFVATGDPDINLTMHDNRVAPVEKVLKCLMNYETDTELCGVCRLRVRGWSYMKDGAFTGFDHTDPTLDGAGSRGPAQAISGFYTDFIV